MHFIDGNHKHDNVCLIISTNVVNDILISVQSALRFHVDAVVSQNIFTVFLCFLNQMFNREKKQ